MVLDNPPTHTQKGGHYFRYVSEIYLGGTNMGGKEKMVEVHNVGGKKKLEGGIPCSWRVPPNRGASVVKSYC